MSWVITPTFYGFITDADAKDYLARVHAAEGQTLEPAVALAVEAFVVGCKADGIWTAIKASCILAGARTLTGALIPLTGTAPTNFNFVSGDYNRKTGLLGNGSTKYLNSNRNNNADQQNSKHVIIYVGASQSVSGVLVGTANSLNTPGDTYIFGDNSGTATARLHSSGTNQPIQVPSIASAGLRGISRSTSSQFVARFNSTAYTSSADASQTPISENLHIFKGGSLYTNARIAFYSIGESLDLALLDTRVTTLINAFAAAIP
jgi:hypothetical protein